MLRTTDLSASVPSTATVTPERVAATLVIATIVIAFLYIGRDILVPLAFASLLSFALWPLIRVLRRFGAGRTVSVLVAVIVALSSFAALGTVLALQMAELAGELPRYEQNLRAKVRALKGASLSSSMMEQAADTIQGLQDELKDPDKVAEAPNVSPFGTPSQSSPATSATRAPPLVVELKEKEPTILQTYQDLAKPLLSPLTTTALVILFLIFILLQREDLRDRILRIAGGGDIQRSTVAMTDAAGRLSRFFLIQLALNSAFGIVIGVGLAFIGVPNPVVWGLLATCMRFVPYIGSVIAAIFPAALAAAVDPSWTMVLWTLGLFAVAEPIAGHVIEPMVYGQSMGLSPVAVVVSALFWTLMWGPVGLLLATPLTVCLAVLGRHIPALEFLEIALGDQPALAPEQRLYQRLLAGDEADAAELADTYITTNSIDAYFDDVAMKALVMAHVDAARGKLDRPTQSQLLETLRELTAELAIDAEAASGIVAGTGDMPEAGAARPGQVNVSVYALATRSALDEAAAALLAQLMEVKGLTAKALGRNEAMELLTRDAPEQRTVVISYFGTQNPLPVRTLVRRIRRAMPNARIVAGFWMLGDDNARVGQWHKATGADAAVTSLGSAVAACTPEPETKLPLGTVATPAAAAAA